MEQKNHQAASNPEQTVQDSAESGTAIKANSRVFARESFVIAMTVASIFISGNLPAQAGGSDVKANIAVPSAAPSFSGRLISASTQVEIKQNSLDGIRIASETHTDNHYDSSKHVDHRFSDSGGFHTDIGATHIDIHEDAFGKISAHQDFVVHVDVTTRHEDVSEVNDPKGNHGDNHKDIGKKSA